MKDQGDYLHNAEGVVDAQIQGTYYANQKLASVSLAGTSFSFAPLMLDDYYPQPSESPEPIGIARTQRIARALRISATK